RHRICESPGISSWRLPRREELRPHSTKGHVKMNLTRVRFKLASLLLIMVITALTSVGAQAGSGIVQVVGTLTRDIAVAPGETVDQAITVQNTGSEPTYVSVYFQEVDFGPDGRVRTTNGPHARGNATWMSGPGEPVLVPG